MEGECELCGAYGDVMYAYENGNDDAECKVVCVDRGECDWNVQLAPLRPYELHPSWPISTPGSLDKG